MKFFKCVRGDRIQLLSCIDIQRDGAINCLRKILPGYVRLVYSDPPWNPGNATYWRTHAGREPCDSYRGFVDAWSAFSMEAISRGATDIFTEQSCNGEHRGYVLDAIDRIGDWPLRLIEEWTVYYGSPGSKSCSRPNVLLHFGHHSIRTNPEGMVGEPMTIRAMAGLDIIPGDWILDQCIGKGMTSRVAHYFDCNCIGTELNQKRLDKTILWLKKQGYEINEQEA